MQRQDVYNRVKAHLHSMVGPARDGSSCVYRGDSGSRCAVGCLIPDDKYDPAIEGLVVARIAENDVAESQAVNYARLADVLEQSGLPPTDRTLMALLARLQQVHDNFDVTNIAETWHQYLDRRLPQVAATHGLEG